MNGFYIKYVKRSLDFLGAFFLLMLLLPFLLLMIIFLSLCYKGNPFFTQRRPGLNTKIFYVIKFKSMKDIFDKNGKLLPNKDRITPIGKFLRKTSLDELPQLFNILKGDMSFVGPRPLFESYLPYYTLFELNRHKVRPGITGLAQVNGRNFLGWGDRLALDIKYVDELSIKNDINILFRTFLKVVKREDISVIPSMTPLHLVREKQNNQFDV